MIETLDDGTTPRDKVDILPGDVLDEWTSEQGTPTAATVGEITEV